MDRPSSAASGPVALGAEPDTPTSPSLPAAHSSHQESPTRRRKSSGTRNSKMLATPEQQQQIPSINVTANTSPISPSDAQSRTTSTTSKPIGVPSSTVNPFNDTSPSSHQQNITHVFGRSPNSKRWLGKKKSEGGGSPNSSTGSLPLTKGKQPGEQEMLNPEDRRVEIGEDDVSDASSVSQNGDSQQHEKKNRKRLSKLMLSVNPSAAEKESHASGSLSPKNPLNWLRKSKSVDEDSS